MDQPKIPTLKDSQKPQVKVRGLGSGLTLFDRFKQFKKKDLAFILAGLGTLLMAPLAEHFMMSPDNGDASSGAFGPGTGGGGENGNGIFGVDRGGGSGDGMAAGGPVGDGSDVITPLNVRDPSSLIMGPGSSQQPPTNSVAPTAPVVASNPGRSDADVRDALAASAVHAAGAAVGKSLLPVPHIDLTNTSLRGLGVLSGNSSSTYSPSGVSSQGLGLSSHGGGPGGGMPGVTGGKNISAIARGPDSGGGGLDGLKAAGDKAGNLFDKAGGTAVGNLNTAANQAIPEGGGSGGGNGAGHTGPNDKAGGDNSAKESKSTGESLAYQLMKENLEKQLDLYWKEKEAADPYLEEMKLRNTALESITGSITGAIGTAVGNDIANMLGGPSAGYWTCNNGWNSAAANVSSTGNCNGSSSATGGTTTTSNPMFYINNGIVNDCTSHQPVTQGGVAATSCWQLGGTSSSSGTTPKTPPPAAPCAGNANCGSTQQAASVDLSQACSSLHVLGGQPTGKVAPLSTYISTMLTKADAVSALQDSLVSGTDLCAPIGGAASSVGVTGYNAELNGAVTGLGGVPQGNSGLLTNMLSAVSATQAPNLDSSQDKQRISKARSDFAKIQQFYNSKQSALSGTATAPQASDIATAAQGINQGVGTGAAATAQYGQVAAELKSDGDAINSAATQITQGLTKDGAVQNDLDGQGDLAGQNGVAAKAVVTRLDPDIQEINTDLIVNANTPYDTMAKLAQTKKVTPTPTPSAPQQLSSNPAGLVNPSDVNKQVSTANTAVSAATTALNAATAPAAPNDPQTMVNKAATQVDTARQSETSELDDMYNTLSADYSKLNGGQPAAQ